MKPFYQVWYIHIFKMALDVFIRKIFRPWRQNNKKRHTLRSSFLLCTADGVALGAAATTDQAGIEMIVFFAIMLHKVPYRIATYKPTNKVREEAH